MMKLNKLASTILLGLAAGSAFAEGAQEAAIRKTLEPRLGDGAKIESVTRTPYAGLFEVRVGGDVLYTDAKADYLFVGRVLDTKTFQDYTRARVDEIN